MAQGIFSADAFNSSGYTGKGHFRTEFNNRLESVKLRFDFEFPKVSVSFSSEALSESK